MSACAPALRPAASVAAPIPSPRPIAATRVPGIAVLGPRETPAPFAPTAAATLPRAVADATAIGHVAATAGLDVHDYEGDERVARYVALFSGPGRESFVGQLGRGTRYEAMIRARLRAAALPEDLYYLPLVESGYDPQATSRVAATGMWQIMAGTARDLGLRMDWWIDERRDPIRATDAAVRNLRWLRSEFGSPLLAAAAYNGGPTRLSKGLAQLAAAESQRADSVRLEYARADSGAAEIAAVDGMTESDAVRAIAVVGPRPAGLVDDDAVAAGAAASADARFFALSSAGYLRTETKNYVPQLIAALLVARDSSRYGITIRPQAPYAYDTVLVAPLTPLAAVATAADATREQLLDLNPHVLRGVTPPGASSVVRVPSGSGAEAARRLDALPESERRAFRRVSTTKRELPTDVAEREGVPLRVLRRYNPRMETVARGKWKGRLVAGQTLRVPTRAVLAYARDVPDAGGSTLAALPRLAPEGVDPAPARVSADKAVATAREPEPTRPSHEATAKARTKAATKSVPNARASAKASAKAKAKRGASAKSHGTARSGAATKPHAGAKSSVKPDARSNAKSAAKRRTSGR